MPTGQGKVEGQAAGTEVGIHVQSASLSGEPRAVEIVSCDSPVGNRDGHSNGDIAAKPLIESSVAVAALAAALTGSGHLVTHLQQRLCSHDPFRVRHAA
jgi:hypothetical protein